MDLDYAETVGNISRSKADTDNGHSGHSKLANYLWHSSPHLISLRDDNEIADLNYGETRDVLFKLKVDVDYEPSPNSGFVNFYPSPNTSRSPLAWNDSEATGIIQNPNSMPKADREDGHSVHSEPVSFARRSIPLSYSFLASKSGYRFRRRRDRRYCLRFESRRQAQRSLWAGRLTRRSPSPSHAFPRRRPNRRSQQWRGQRRCFRTDGRLGR